jgi:hypothetical protein
MKRNAYSGPCIKCGRIVEKGAGFFERKPGYWAVRHHECTKKFIRKYGAEAGNRTLPPSEPGVP